ncbi:MAG TPA: protein YgfX [Chitinolyticbacter sp.]|nr:protein YgfX [Chitinolyticbacter sp.]
MHSAPRVECRFGPSRRGRFWLVAIHGCAALVAFSLPLWWCVGSLVAIAISASSAARQPMAGTLSAPGDGTLWLDSGSGAVLIDVLPGSLVTASLVVLRYRNESGQRGALTLWPDSADADSLRRLRIWLRWQRPAPAEPASVE